MELLGRVLLVDDERDLADPILSGLGDLGFETGYAEDGTQAIRLLEQIWDVLILDLMLPDIDGESILQFSRRTRPAPCVLVLSARTTISDKLSLFRLGCDDYISKPFSLEELFERVLALVRRKQGFDLRPQLIQPEQDMELDTSLSTFRYKKKKVPLTPKEAAILQMLLTHPGKVVHRREILHSVWGLKVEPDTNFIGVHFSNLRRKLAKAGCADSLETIRSSGFRFTLPHDA